MAKLHPRVTASRQRWADLSIPFGEKVQTPVNVSQWGVAESRKGDRLPAYASGWPPQLLSHYEVYKKNLERRSKKGVE